MEAGPDGFRGPWVWRLPDRAPSDGDLAPAVDPITVPGSRPEAAEGCAAWDDAIEPPDPCAGCGGLLSWWNALEDQRCLACDPPAAGIRALEKAEGIRRRLGIPSPAGAAEMLAKLKCLTDTCISANQ